LKTAEVQTKEDTTKRLGGGCLGRVWKAGKAIWDRKDKAGRMGMGNLYVEEGMIEKKRNKRKREKRLGPGGWILGRRGSLFNIYMMYNGGMGSHEV